MEVILDSNVLFSALISGKELYLDIFKSLKIYVPDFIFGEISKYQERIISKTRLQSEFIFFTRQLFSEITVIPRLAISQQSFEKALSICHDIDPKDTAFVALSIELNVPLWTNDKKLIDGLMGKQFENVITTEEIFELTVS
ncbi:MAG: PIN domain-containing protein [Chloroflexi bacterium]|nr:PIN domain-containing protein [Chloroflexota bacterium]